ncbi:hypothetical protein PRZ48_011622 [Zasmidium cellare]|uniref:Uncharacterized protein n=1 Tax=Zasmidium cellare TaxID=395010 RepID=A0ABR0E6W4_ZASCE|nr:hypothetical protein PRZ48_011622 [Zasmidium cellare]
MDKSYPQQPNHPNRDRSQVPRPDAVIVSLKYWNQVYRNKNNDIPMTRASQWSIFAALMATLRLRHEKVGWTVRDYAQITSYLTGAVAAGKLRIRTNKKRHCIPFVATSVIARSYVFSEHDLGRIPPDVFRLELFVWSMAASTGSRPIALSWDKQSHFDVSFQAPKLKDVELKLEHGGKDIRNVDMTWTNWHDKFKDASKPALVHEIRPFKDLQKNDWLDPIANFLGMLCVRGMALASGGRVCRTPQEILDAMHARTDKTLQYRCERHHSSPASVQSRDASTSEPPPVTSTTTLRRVTRFRSPEPLSVLLTKEFNAGMATENTSFVLGHSSKSKAKGVSERYSMSRATNLNNEREKQEVERQARAKQQQPLVDDSSASPFSGDLAAGQTKFFDTILTSHPVDSIELMIWKNVHLALRSKFKSAGATTRVAEVNAAKEVRRVRSEATAGTGTKGVHGDVDVDTVLKGYASLRTRLMKSAGMQQAPAAMDDNADDNEDTVSGDPDEGVQQSHDAIVGMGHD